MSLVVTDKAAWADYDAGGLDVITSASFSIVSGATLLVALAASATFSGANSVTWNGHALTRDNSLAPGSGRPVMEHWRLSNAPAGSGVCVVVMTSSSVGGIAACACEVTGLSNSSPVDDGASGSGASGSASTGTTDLSEDGELVFASAGDTSGGQPVDGGFSFSAGHSSEGGILFAADGTSVGISYDWCGATTPTVAADNPYALDAIMLDGGLPWTALLTTYKPAGSSSALEGSASDSAIAADARAATVHKALADAATVTDAAVAHPTKARADAVSAADALIISGASLISVMEADVHAADEITGKTINATIEDFVAIEDALGSEVEQEAYPSRDAQGTIDTLIKPWDGTPFSPEETRYFRATDGLQACGAAYFAAVSANLLPEGVSGGETRMVIFATIKALPTMLADPDEPHYLASWHEAVHLGRELFSLGITPSGRLCAKTKDSPLIVTAPGVVTASPVPRMFALQMYSGSSLDLSLDGVVIVSYVGSGLSFQGPASPDGYPVRFMLYNGIEGKTRCACVIHHAEMVPENDSLRWPFTEGSGLSLHDEEYQPNQSDPNLAYKWFNRDDILSALDAPPYPYPVPYPQVSDYAGAWDLAVQWYDPSVFGYPLAWGSVPSSSPTSCAQWIRTTLYTLRNPSAPAYQRTVIP